MSTPAIPPYIAEIADAVEKLQSSRSTKKVEVVWSVIYRTTGGTVIIASAGYGNDDGRPRDLMAVLPYPLDSGRVLPLYLATNPDVVAALDNELTRRAAA